MMQNQWNMNSFVNKWITKHASWVDCAEMPHTYALKLTTDLKWELYFIHTTYALVANCNKNIVLLYSIVRNRRGTSNCMISTFLRSMSMYTWNIDLCAIEYSLGDAPTALKHGDEACLHIWHLMSKLSIASSNHSCKLLTDKMNLLIKCSSAIWFLTIQNTLENSHFAWENLFKFIFSKINWSYNRHNVSATIWDQKFLLKSDLYCPDHLDLHIKTKISSAFSTWCIRFWDTLYRHQMMTQLLKLSYN